MKQITQRRHLWILLMFMLLAAAVRLPRLGNVDLRGDEIELYEYLRRGMTVVQYLQLHVRDFAMGRQLPVPRTATCAFIRLLDLEVSQFTVRLPFAIVGILIVPALWLFGKYAWDQRFGYILAFMGAINPYNIYWSRTAHIYAFPMLFVTLTAAYAASAARSTLSGDALKLRHTVLACLYSVLACYSHMSAWPAVVLLWGFVLGLHYWLKLRGKPVPAIAAVWIAFSIWAFLMLPWVILFLGGLRAAMETTIYKESRKTNINPVARLSGMWRIPFLMTWGWGRRSVMTIGLTVCGVVGGLRSRTDRSRTLTVILFGAVIFVLASVMMSTGFHSFRYYLPLWLVFLSLSGAGLILIAGKLGSVERFHGKLKEKTWLVALGGCLLAAMINPVKCLIMLPGNTMPFSRVSQWFDANLPKNTPVVGTGGHQLMIQWRPYFPTNVYLTYTLPDAGMEFWLKHRWRDTARDFVLKFPDTAVFEHGRSYDHLPGVGPWTWPRQYFRRHVTITNEEALALRKMGLGPGMDYYNIATNQIITEIFFNLPRDVVDMARDAGKSSTVLWGDGWKYAKTRDYRDWRVLQDRAVINAYNLTSNSLDAVIIIRGVAVGGSKRVRTSRGSERVFAAGQFVEWRTNGVQLKPGCTRISLVDGSWSKKRIPLFVERIDML